MKKILFFIRIGFQSVFLYGSYVKPVSSHEAVFVGSTNFPKDLQQSKSRSSIRKDKRIRILQASL
jgi:hypothetical protein